MAGFLVDLSDVQDFGAINAFPNGIYAARVLSGKFDLNKAGNLALYLDIEIMSESLGTAQLKWQISSKAPFTLKQLWVAVNDFTPEQFAENPVAKIEDPNRLVGCEFLADIGRKPSQDGTREFVNVVGAYPLNRYQDFADQDKIQ